MTDQPAQTRSLFRAVLLFVLLDLTVLLINYWIAHQVSHDAVAINLSGRQRMLSQRMTKALLQNQSPDAAERASSEREFREAALMFDQTLNAFDRSGPAIGSDGQTVTLQRITERDARTVINATRELWTPMRAQVLPQIRQAAPLPAATLDLARRHLLQHNLELLRLMNQLASHLEQDSMERANLLRLAQTTVFILAFLNFVVIVRGFHLLTRKAELANRHLGRLAMHDPLTGLYNRRQFEEALKREIAAADRRKCGFALLLLDLDEFKPVNDRHGHHSGDQVLQIIAGRLTAQARSHDTVARIGGDEFVLICPDLSDEEAAAALCQRILAHLNEPIALDDAQASVGASIGIAFYPVHAHTPDDLFRAADQAMYAAKQGGRNRCRIADTTQAATVDRPR